MNDRERVLQEELSRIADEAQLRPGMFEAALHRAQRRRRVAATATAAALIAIVLVATVVLPDGPDVQEPVAPEEERTHSPIEVETHTIDIGDQPLALDISQGSVWVTTGMRELVEIRGERIRDRYAGGGVGVAISGRTAWLTAGGDGAEPDGSLTGIDLDSGALVQRAVFPSQSPYGVDAGRGGIFVALDDGDLARLHPGGDEEDRVALASGLGDVLVAHGAVWVSQTQGDNPKVWRVTLDDAGSNATPFLLTPQGKGSCPGGLAATPDAVWVADPCAAVLWKLDPSGGVLGRIDNVGRKPVDVAAGPRFLFVSSFRGDELVTLIDRRTEKVVAQVEAGEGPGAIVADRNGAWVANSEGRSLTHIRPGRRDG